MVIVFLFFVLIRHVGSNAWPSPEILPLRRYLMIVKIVDPNLHLVIVMATAITLNFDEKMLIRL